MTYKTIVVHEDAGARCAVRRALAFNLAQAHGAHVVGLFVLESVRLPSYAVAEAGPTFMETARRLREQRRAACEAQFRDAAARAGAKAEWRESGRDPLGALVLSGRYADLVVIGQPTPAAERDDDLPPGFAGQVVLGLGRPVLLVPYAGTFPEIGRRVLVAWNASREAARAVCDALPLLRNADIVQVLAVDPARAGDHGEVPGADIALYLARHGVKASAAQASGRGTGIGEQILSRAADLSADLIVMGGYGHSRVRELVLGGVTRTLLESMTVPVLMSH